MLDSHQKSRRRFIKTVGLAVGAGVAPTTTGLANFTSSHTADTTSARPVITHGIQFGDASTDQAVVWSRADRPARMIVEYSLQPDFSNAQLAFGTLATENTDYTARIDLTGLPAGQQWYVKVLFQDLKNPKNCSFASVGKFRTAPEQSGSVRFLWSGDTCGQGWGINPDIGGMRIYETMRSTAPDFFIHCGDGIYADCPIPKTQIVEETGEVWRNILIPEVTKVAETLPEFRARYKYNLMDQNLRRFNAEVPTIWLWDDHEITNNWSPSKDLTDDARYQEKQIANLVASGRTAALEYAPMRTAASDQQQRIYRIVPYGPLLDVFVLDMRSYRAANNYNRQVEPSDETAYLGTEQLNWLKQGLQNSTAVWKVIAADMPLGLRLGDGLDEQQRQKFENVANGDGPVLGRELEIAELLSFVKEQGITNMVWFTADVHYCAAHYYDPAKAVFKDFNPFWEFVSGPLNATSFGAQKLDNTFGAQLIFQKAAPNGNLSPLSGFQFFGQVDIRADDQVMTVTLKDIDSNDLFVQEISPKV
jgi:alkaline phosphatase D